MIELTLSRDGTECLINPDCIVMIEQMMNGVSIHLSTGVKVAVREELRQVKDALIESGVCCE